MLAKTVPDFILLALKIAQVLFVTRTRISFSFLELKVQSSSWRNSLILECAPLWLVQEGTPQPCIKSHLLRMLSLPTPKPVGLEKPQCLA